MASLSLKLLAVGAAISIGAILGAKTSNAAPVAAAAPMAIELGSAASPLAQVDYRYYRPHYHPAACTPRQAAHKASRMGIRNQHVVVNRNVVRVAGWKRGLRTIAVFARAPGCPFIR
ncbi:antifreeze protein [Phyllobacterium lublinensis]|uniref:antifreeze protein n=1 Tax=Phyllobacterium lublinensis TaxID=2875708 RepID=UPI001CCBF444|nr:antifreeze protein [Phyllobacterium sp. 2063]MBZ9656734.1 antifreeze protein [Phyllobacterium sp. 2063]